MTILIWKVPTALADLLEKRLIVVLESLLELAMVVPSRAVARLKLAESAMDRSLQQ